MPEIFVDSPDPTCYHLFSGTGSKENQLLGPDPFSSRARDARGHFANGHSGNPQSRPPGIPNPKRRVLDLQGWRANRQAALALLDRKPWLWRPLLAQILPPHRAIDPAERLGVRPASLRSQADLQRAVRKIWAALSRGEIAPAEAARLSRRVLRAVQRLERTERRLTRPAQKTNPVRPPLG